MNIDLDLFESLGAKIINRDLFIQPTSICYNIVTSKPNGLYIDFGNSVKYIDDSIHLGIICFIGRSSIIYNITQIIADNIDDIVNQYVILMRNKYNGKVITVCGTSGKSTTKYLLSQLLPNNLVTNRSCNFFNIIKYYFLILKHKYFICELACNDEFLLKACELLLPDYTIITNINYEHMSETNSIENIFALEKAIIPYSKNIICPSYVYIGPNSYNEYDIKIYNDTNKVIGNIYGDGRYTLLP